MVEQLEAAVESGRMDQVDALSDSLAALTDHTGAVTIPYAKWQQLMAAGDFSAGYVLTATALRAALETDFSFVPTFTALLMQAVERGCSILQLPREEVA